MGYDMYIKGELPGVAEETAAAQEMFNEACKTRNALSDQQGSFLSPEEAALPEGERKAVSAAKNEEMMRLIEQEKVPWDEARFRVCSIQPSDAYKEMQAKVEEAYEALHRAEKNYFRLNIWGMSEAREILFSLGMLKESASDGDWPKPPEMDPVLLETLQEALFDSEGDPAEWVQTPTFKDTLTESIKDWNDSDYRKKEGRPELAEPTEEEIQKVVEYWETCNAHLAGVMASRHGIEVRKLCSNDGWLVTPEECKGAVKIWDDHPQEVRDKIAEDKPYVAEFVEWIRLAGQNGGFTVH